MRILITKINGQLFQYGGTLPLAALN